MNEPLTPEQIANWRKILAVSFGLGSYAFIMPEADILRFRDKLQLQANQMATPTPEDA